MSLKKNSDNFFIQLRVVLLCSDSCVVIISRKKQAAYINMRFRKLIDKMYFDEVEPVFFNIR